MQGDNQPGQRLHCIPFFSMMAMDTSISPCVWDRSEDGFSAETVPKLLYPGLREASEEMETPDQRLLRLCSTDSS